jgi:hypothetical protein
MVDLNDASGKLPEDSGFSAALAKHQGIKGFDETSYLPTSITRCTTMLLMVPQVIWCIER